MKYCFALKTDLKPIVSNNMDRTGDHYTKQDTQDSHMEVNTDNIKVLWLLYLLAFGYKYCFIKSPQLMPTFVSTLR